ncbi:FAD synthetase family protein [Peribacillus frigoritolerans]|uniref:FAD synthetase family protein n=1 Tax=Peribacillus frigoritolerans TaxID=450367 RepID=UPI002EA79914|nr:FAD synthetase family protein [Peribacillus frigoritolerans]
MLKYYKDLFNPKLSELEHGSYITIGTFDGVHKGHQRLISNVVREGKKNNYSTIAITFDPLPKTFFGNGGSESSRLTSPYTRAERIGANGIDILIEYTFNQSFSTISAADFINEILVGLNPKKIFIGEDFRFGYKGSGNSAVLKQAGLTFGFETKILKFIELGKERISSTRVRHAIKNGNLELATELMGKHHEISGKIVRKMNDFKVSFVPNYDIILPPAGEYMVDVGDYNDKHSTKAIILNPNKSIDIILAKPMINSFSNDNVILRFLQSGTTIKNEEIKLKTYKERRTILS